MLGRRLVIGGSMAITLALLAWLDLALGDSTGRIGLVLGPIAMLGAIVAADEVRYMLLKIGGSSRRLIVMVGTFLVVGLSLVPGLFSIDYLTCHFGLLGWAAMGLAAAIGLAFVSEMLVYRSFENPADRVTPVRKGAAIQRVIESIFIFGYIGILMSFLSALRFFHDNAWGLFAFLSVVLIVKFSDSCAYAAGKLFGTQKMAPLISPGKTVQGAIGALAGGIVMSVIAFEWFAPWITGGQGSTSLPMAIAYGLAVALAGMAGDLAESLLKRETGCKDSSTWLPGLGGITDVLDSMLPAAPAAFMFWAAGWVAP